MMPPPNDAALPEPGTPEWNLLLTRYVSGETTHAERARVEAWVAASTRHAEELAVWRAVWGGGVTTRRNRFDVRAAERSLGRRLDASDAAARESADPEVQVRGAGAGPRRRPGGVGAGGVRQRLWHTARIAAVIVVIAGGAWIARSGERPAPAQQFREFASAPGSRTTIMLRDGSRLVLGPDTRLRVPTDFGVGSRTVELIGMASFAVVHDTRHPFAVRAGRALVRDVGTTFVVRAYADDGVDRVGVQEGQVLLGRCVNGSRPCVGSDTDARLVPGDLAIVSDTIVSIGHAADLALVTAWEQGGLKFDHTPLRQVALDISRAFDVQVTLADSAMAGLLVTATFSEQPLELVLSEVANAVGAHYERTARTIVIRRGVTGASDDRRRPRVPFTTAVR